MAVARFDSKCKEILEGDRQGLLEISHSIMKQKPVPVCFCANEIWPSLNGFPCHLQSIALPSVMRALSVQVFVSHSLALKQAE